MFGGSLRRTGRGLLTAAGHSLEGAEGAEAIHGLRKTLKRWRAFLRLVAPAAGDRRKALDVAARDVAQSLGRARDHQAALDALGDLKAKALDPTARSKMAERLTALRDQAQGKALPTSSGRAAARVLREARQSLDVMPLDAMETDAIASALRHGYRRARRAVPDNWNEATPDELHALRKWVVVHRSQMELLKQQLPRLGRKSIRDAQRLRSQLGRYRDLVLLAQLTRKGGALASWRNNLLPVIAGNLIGGSVLVALVYYLIYRRGQPSAPREADGHR